MNMTIYNYALPMTYNCSIGHKSSQSTIPFPLINYSSNSDDENHSKQENICSYKEEKIKGSYLIVQQKRKRKVFTKEEDEKIKELTAIHGTKQWNLIAGFIKGRTAKQIRDRYFNYLFPGFFSGEWSNEEDELLIELYNKYGPRWTVLQKSFQNRSANTIKNRWDFFLCRQFNKKQYDDIASDVENNANSKENKNCEEKQSDKNETKVEHSIDSNNDNSLMKSADDYSYMFNDDNDDGSDELFNFDNILDFQNDWYESF